MAEDPAVLKFKELAAKFMANAPPEEERMPDDEEIPDDFPPEDTRGYRTKPLEKVGRSPSRSRSRSRSPKKDRKKDRHDYSSDSDSGPELVTSQTYGRKPEKKSSSSGSSRGGGGGRGFGGSRGPNRSSSKIIKVPNDKVSMIIGKGGSQIKEIQSNTGAQVKIPDANHGSMDREITIIGSDDQQQRAIDMINSIISQDRTQRSDRGGRDRGGPGGGYGGGRNELKLEMQIPNDRVGLVIGKQGATISEIKQQSGAYISVQREASNGSTTPVTISAKTQDSLDHAKHLIEEKIEGGRDSGRGRGGRFGRDSYEHDQGQRYDQDQRYPYEQDQGGYYSNQQPQFGQGETIGDWTSCIDPKSGYPYWANLKTGETSWERPSQ